MKPGTRHDLCAFNAERIPRSWVAQEYCVRQFTNDDWTFHFFLRTHPDGAALDGAAEIFRRGAMYHQLMSAHPSADREEILQSLMQACQDWVSAWRRRLQDAETAPADLR